MKKAIASFGYDRPEMMRVSFDSLQACSGIEKYDWFCFIDGQGKAQRAFYQEDYQEIRFNIRDQRLGLNSNILLAFKDLFEFYKYDHIIYVEDDVIVSDDFLEYCEYCHEHYRTDDIFTVSGFARRIHNGRDTESRILKLNWYHPWGNLIDRKDYELFQPHIMPYLGNPLEYMLKLGDQLKEINYKHYEREFLNAKTVTAAKEHPELKPYLNMTQDCLLNAVRALNHKYQLMPCYSRTQNIGFYGQHQRDEYKGEDLNDPIVQMRSIHATDSFKQHYQWTSLELMDEIQN